MRHWGRVCYISWKLQRRDLCTVHHPNTSLPWRLLQRQGEKRWLVGLCVCKRVMVHLDVGVARPLSYYWCLLDLFTRGPHSFVFLITPGDTQRVCKWEDRWVEGGRRKGRAWKELEQSCLSAPWLFPGSHLFGQRQFFGLHGMKVKI